MNKKNQGSSLVLILIVMFVILTLSLTLLSASSMNINMKRVDGKSKENFYSAETALNEINVGLEELVTKQIKKAYINLLERYSDIHPSQRDTEFAEKYMDYLYLELSDATSPIVASEKLRNLLDSYVLVTPKYTDSTKLGVKVNATGKPQPTLSINMTDYKATIHNVYIEYINKDFETIIQTDIVIKCPEDINFDSLIVSGKENNLSTFAVVADNKIQIATDTTTSHSNIIGNVYAGKNGIIMKNEGTMLSMSSQEIITRGDINVADKAKLYISGTGGNRIWANNLVISNSPGTDSNRATTMNIFGNCIVANDLMLNAKRSFVKINGTYNGFRTNKVADGVGIHDNGSAIIINGKDSTLDLSNISSLTVAGNASISIPEYSIGGVAPSSKQILMGDSIVAKANQLAYLVPECCLSSNHNPVIVNDVADEVVDLTKETTIPLANYVNPVTPYRTVFYSFEDGKKVVYYYLNFENDEKAAEYMMKFYEKKRDSFDDYSALFPVNRMDIKGSSIKSNGVSSKKGNPSSGIDLIGPTSEKSYLENEEIVYQGLYTAMTQKLTTGSIPLTTIDSDSLVNTYINLPLIKSEASSIDGTILYASDPTDLYDVKVIYNGEGEKANLSIGEQKGTPVIVNSHTRGIIVASGDIIVRSDFTGLLIAGGDISIQDNASVYADSVIVDYIWNKREDAFNKYFHITNTAPGTPGDSGLTINDTIDISNLLSYENWRKK